MGERCPNNNYLESDKIAVGHGVCGDPPQGGLDNPNTYSTPNTLWPPISTYESGSIIEIRAVINNNHWGHIEYFLCDTADMDDADGVVTQDCLNKYPLDRDETDWWNSPIDPNYPGRFFVNPECRGENEETDQSGRPELTGGGLGLDKGYINNGRYHLPNIQCEHCVLQMKYYAYVGCHHPGYHEFEPEWPGDCAPDKEDWLPHKNPGCSDEGQKWGNVFFGCSDITLVANGEIDLQGNPSCTCRRTYHRDLRNNINTQFLVQIPTPPIPEQVPLCMCYEHCYSEGAAYMATQFGFECWCSDDTDLDYSRHSDNIDGGDGLCTTACQGDTCWRERALDACAVLVDRRALLVEEGDEVDEYVGCFADDPEDRLLGNEIKYQPDMTQAVCRTYCEGYDAHFYATQYGDECWCGMSNDEEDYKRHGSGSCLMECSGDPGTVCGGNDAFNLYKNMDKQ
ncbi:EsV-1-166 [Ectocarpus siliculosus]|uniref:EsV-1-166 n=1 Tax=Ectocarpus siliculosus TaxID=2880 RepID=D8LED5_ECTSI|nr:EsV-1-166 [Ectocarpus siliculosus]|eukprot:CBN74220.1 EsV-1-166 [Ectocarpus siliculosus]